MSLKKELATPAQYAQFGLLVAQQVVEKMGQKEGGFSKTEIQQLLTPPHNDKVKEIVDSVVAHVFEIKLNIWQRQMEKLNKFWQENFNHEILWSELLFPEKKEGLDVLEYIPSCFTEDDIYDKYAEVFGKDKVWCYYYDESKKIRESITEQQPRPSANRLILHRGGQEPDIEHLNKSYRFFYQDGKKYMIPIEGIIAAFRYRIETGKMMDVIGSTRFHVLDYDGFAMSMCGDNNGTFFINRGRRVTRNAKCGPREISF